MAETINCPHCGYEYPKSKRLVDRPVRCRNCQNSFMLRADGDVEKVALTQRLEKTGRFRKKKDAAPSVSSVLRAEDGSRAGTSADGSMQAGEGPGKGDAKRGATRAASPAKALACPHCGYSYPRSPKLIDRPVRCKNCKHNFVVRQGWTVEKIKATQSVTKSPTQAIRSPTERASAEAKLGGGPATAEPAEPAPPVQTPPPPAETADERKAPAGGRPTAEKGADQKAREQTEPAGKRAAGKKAPAPAASAGEKKGEKKAGKKAGKKAPTRSAPPAAGQAPVAETGPAVAEPPAATAPAAVGEPAAAEEPPADKGPTETPAPPADTLACPHCGRRYPRNPKLIDQPVRCKGCQKTFVVREGWRVEKIRVSERIKKPADKGELAAKLKQSLAAAQDEAAAATATPSARRQIRRTSATSTSSVAGGAAAEAGEVTEADVAPAAAAESAETPAEAPAAAGSAETPAEAPAAAAESAETPAEAPAAAESAETPAEAPAAAAGSAETPAAASADAAPAAGDEAEKTKVESFDEIGSGVVARTRAKAGKDQEAPETFPCPHCGEHFPVREDLVGKETRCTSCGGRFRLGADGEAVAGAEGPSTAARLRPDSEATARGEHRASAPERRPTTSQRRRSRSGQLTAKQETLRKQMSQRLQEHATRASKVEAVREGEREHLHSRGAASAASARHRSGTSTSQRRSASTSVLGQSARELSDAILTDEGRRAGRSRWIWIGLLLLLLGAAAWLVVPWAIVRLHPERWALERFTLPPADEKDELSWQWPYRLTTIRKRAWLYQTNLPVIRELDAAALADRFTVSAAPLAAFLDEFVSLEGSPFFVDPENEEAAAAVLAELPPGAMPDQVRQRLLGDESLTMMAPEGIAAWLQGKGLDRRAAALGALLITGQTDDDGANALRTALAELGPPAGGLEFRLFAHDGGYQMVAIQGSYEYIPIRFRGYLMRIPDEDWLDRADLPAGWRVYHVQSTGRREEFADSPLY